MIGFKGQVADLFQTEEAAESEVIRSGLLRASIYMMHAVVYYLSPMRINIAMTGRRSSNSVPIGRLTYICMCRHNTLVNLLQ